MQDIELITNFFTGKLEGRQLEAFRERLNTEPEFQALARSYWPAFDGFKALRVERFREQVLLQWEAELRESPPESFQPGFLTGEPSTMPGKPTPAAAEEIPDYQILLEGLEGLRREKFEEQARTWAEEERTGQTVPKRKPTAIIRIPRLARYGIAATILLLLALTVVWKFMPGASDNTFTAFRQEAYISPSTSAMNRAEGANSLKKAIRNLESGQYPATLQALQPVAPSDSLYLAALYLKGHAYYRMGQYENARLRLDSLANFPQREGYFLKGVNVENARWASILAALAQWEQEGQPDKAGLLNMVRQFLETSNPEDAYHTKAQELMELLEGF